MMSLFDNLAFDCSRKVTHSYSTSFSSAVNMLAPSIRPAIHSIYGFVRFADEIVDTFHKWNKSFLLDKFEKDFYLALEMGISLNPILHSFQETVKQYNIDLDLIDAFLHSMKMDLTKKDYNTTEEYKQYIYGSADVVGLMCLKVFVNGDERKYDELKDSAMALGSAFQKVNFLRDLKSDIELLNRSYFPNVDLRNLDAGTKQEIIQEIEEDFRKAYAGIIKLPATSKFGVYTAYIYYSRLLKKLKDTPSREIMSTRIRVPNYAKMGLLMKSYVNTKLNLL
ncbi:MAG: phytoene/squalene synthase family protein [Bacteroidetes bacterium]|nr:MAG: phytoene/squalene synthase family protein [Bacteroidota bacterium]